jgi:hypothetical protein
VRVLEGKNSYERTCKSLCALLVLNKPESTKMKTILMTPMMLVASVIGFGQPVFQGPAINPFGQQASHSPAIDPPVHTVSTDGTLRIQLNGAAKDWLLGANVAPAGATGKVQVFEIDRDYKDESLKAGGQGFAKAVSYPPVSVLSNTAQVNGVGLHDTTAVYVEAPAWTTIVIVGPKDEVLYQTPLRKTLLVSRGVESGRPNIRDVRSLLPSSEWTHEARLRFWFAPSRTRSILQTKQR